MKGKIACPGYKVVKTPVQLPIRKIKKHYIRRIKKCGYRRTKNVEREVFDDDDMETKAKKTPPFFKRKRHRKQNKKNKTKARNFTKKKK